MYISIAHSCTIVLHNRIAQSYCTIVLHNRTAQLIKISQNKLGNDRNKGRYRHLVKDTL